MSIDKALRQTMQDQVKEKVVWTNVSPASEFGAQNIAIDLAGWKEVTLITGASSTSLTGDATVPIDGEQKRVYANTIYSSRRNVTASVNGIEFDDAYQDKGNGFVVENLAVKPLVIIARKIINGGAID